MLPFCVVSSAELVQSLTQSLAASVPIDSQSLFSSLMSEFSPVIPTQLYVVPAHAQDTGISEAASVQPL